MNELVKGRARIGLAICWGVIASFVAVSVYWGWETASIMSPRGSILPYCGNAVADPLGSILGFGTPAGIVAVAGLAYLSHRGLAVQRSVIAAALLTVGCTMVLAAYGHHLFHESMPGAYLSHIVWWLRPLAGF